MVYECLFCSCVEDPAIEISVESVEIIDFPWWTTELVLFGFIIVDDDDDVVDDAPLKFCFFKVFVFLVLSSFNGIGEDFNSSQSS